MSITVIVHGAAVQPRGDAPEKSPLPSMTFDGARIVLGRGEGCEVRLPDPSVSHRHCSIRQRGAEYMLVDEGSTNGTRMARVLLSPHSPRVIKSGELVRVGRVWAELRVEPAPPTPSATMRAKEVALELVVRGLADQGEDARPLVRVEEGPDAGRELRLDAGTRVVVGRSREAQLTLDDAELSRRHIELGTRGDLLVVRDLGSKSKTLIGDREVGSVDVVWKPGERLTIGQSVLVYSFEAAIVLAEIERSPDEKLSSAELEMGHAAVLEAPADPAPEESDVAPSVDDDEPAFQPDARIVAASRRKSGWGLTDVAVVLFALGVMSLSAVGYFALLR